MTRQDAPYGTQKSAERRVAVAVRGVVQGVGFRPFVYGLAKRLGIAGWVRNEADLVRIEAQGTAAAVDDFLLAIKKQSPPQAKIDHFEVRELKCPAEPEGGFRILAGSGDSRPRPTIPADLATCRDCLAEIRDATERRYRYPFTNCTNCGPRWSIISGLPYDRPRTAMAAFTLCPDCRREYEDPADRRFHAQPIACPACGPRLSLLDKLGRETATAGVALESAAAMVRSGWILALKGLGGFQLIADAANAAAVELLRSKKRRPHKPLAVMAASLAEARRYCQVTDEESRLLESAAAPIVLLRRKTSEVAEIAENVAPGNPYLGVMLPYTPLHHLLLEAVAGPVVCTSGNLSEEPMAITIAEAAARLGGIADAFLVHDRDIVRPVDDSVARVVAGKTRILRRARGYAPLPIEIPALQNDKSSDKDSTTVLAVGGHLKNAVALKLGRQAVVGAHVGDLDCLESVDVHHRAIDDLLDFFQTRPDVIACDLHPDYASTRHAEMLSRQWNVPLVRVQHHHAHVAACMAEHSLTGPVLGLAWDGSGYGPDKTVWGGEAFLCSGDDKKSDALTFTRVAHLRTFGLPGGDRAVRCPPRSALGAIFEIDADEAACLGTRWFAPDQLHPLLTMLRHGTLCPRTSSMGRLFDAVAAMCGLPIGAHGQIIDVSFEGQAAMALEFAAEKDLEESYEFPLGDGCPAVADWSPLQSGVGGDLSAGVPLAIISMKFHNALAGLALAIAERIGCKQVVLSGGCFQNALLSELVERRLTQAGFEVYAHEKVPPGDGGICLGQALIASSILRGY